ncbi:unnamed protein product [Arctia plantaginis]|uniref:Uncharacterized protein n=1 Tax=Arctia plantaginis TaxID=874455 RepID=A0A8S1A0L1_ARCPL|nr:unnamed protein product [Arctia plantaginis]CAB3239250.1 unnamed protein product [Arctia plantaginis]
MESEIHIVDKPVSMVFEAGSLASSEDPPVEEWSSLEMVFEEKNPKRILEQKGLYDPGAPDICSKYIAMSSSSVTRHVYYRYPCIVDPGILSALFSPEAQTIYPDDGQNLYLAVCKEMNQYVVRCFYKGLLDKYINLSYYGVNPNGVRAMALALKYNKIVQNINFTDNFLNNDACLHLGEMLATNTYLVELNLTGCRIGPLGIRNLLDNMISNKTLKILNLSRNEIGDDGMVHFADAVFKGLNVKEVNLSHNNISGKGVALLVEPFQTYNKITHWDLSWNNLYSPGTSDFLNAISETTETLTDMNLSYNGLRQQVGWGLKRLLTVKDIQNVDLSHNLLQGQGIKDLCASLSSAKKLVSLNLGYNPMTPADACVVLKKLKLKKVKVLNVSMDNVTVGPSFLVLLKEVKEIKPEINLTFGHIVGAFKGVGPDYRQVLFKRLDYLCNKPKTNKVDIALVLLQLQKNKVIFMLAKEFFYLLYRAGAPVDADLMDHISNRFPGPKAEKGDKTVDINALVEYSTRMFPERKLPPTPPPELELPLSNKGKGKKKGKT